MNLIAKSASILAAVAALAIPTVASAHPTFHGGGGFHGGRGYAPHYERGWAAPRVYAPYYAPRYGGARVVAPHVWGQRWYRR
jgi:hypothetical protein